MFTHNRLLAASLILAAPFAQAESPGLGKAVPQNEIPFYAAYVMPDGRGLPEGSGTAVEGGVVYAQLCANCHGETGIEGPIMPPVGPNDVWAKPAGRHWPYATTLFDYIRRAMPFDAPKSLTNDEVYSLAAYILHRNGLVAEDEAMNAETLPEVEMPNRDKFIDVWEKQGEKPW